MKYGLITIHRTKNCGSLLQTYSTYKAIEAMGKDVELIDYKNEAIDQREIPLTMRKTKSIKDFVRILLWGNSQGKKYACYREFLKNNTRMSKEYDRESIGSSNDRYDCFISGSDIVWGLNITGNDYSYFLDFAKESKKKIAFSSSVGTKWEDNKIPRIKQLLKRYDAISVREKMTADWVGKMIGKTVETTCDPTMLWERTFWEQYVLQDYAPDEKYVLIYAANPNKKNISDGIDYAQKHKMKAYYINFYTPVPGTKTIRPITVEQWITLIAKADTVFSASYHGLLFSLYFHRNVFFYNRGEKERMISFSKEIGIEHREGVGTNVQDDRAIDYKTVDNLIEQKCQNAWDYLKRVL